MAGDLISAKDLLEEIETVKGSLHTDGDKMPLKHLRALESLMKVQRHVGHMVAQQQQLWERSSERLPLEGYLSGCLANDMDEPSGATLDEDGEIIGVVCAGRLMYVETQAGTEAYETERLCAKHAHEWLLRQMTYAGSSLPISIREAA